MQFESIEFILLIDNPHHHSNTDALSFFFPSPNHCFTQKLQTAEMVAQFAQNEQNMNAVERVLHYTELDPEGVLETPNDPPPVWPSKGEITFTDVELAYRDGLPLVLKGISFNITPGEKVNS